MDMNMRRGLCAIACIEAALLLERHQECCLGWEGRIIVLDAVKKIFGRIALSENVAVSRDEAILILCLTAEIVLDTRNWGLYNSSK